MCRLNKRISMYGEYGLLYGKIKAIKGKYN